uniref:Uncharacterized protein n=1 Tax=Cyanistes caeruleus TaxID=156563 RepID=A0A8C0UXN2_CYACU
MDPRLGHCNSSRFKHATVTLETQEIRHQKSQLKGELPQSPVLGKSLSDGLAPHFPKVFRKNTFLFSS